MIKINEYEMMELTLTSEQARALYCLIGHTNFDKRQEACTSLGEGWDSVQDDHVCSIWDELSNFYDKW